MGDNILTRQEVAEKFKLKLPTLDYLVQTKQIPYSRLGKRLIRFSRKRLEKWFAENEGRPYSPTGENE